MPWLKIQFVVDNMRADLLADALNAAGALSVTLEPEESDPGSLTDSGNDLPGWPRVRVSGLYGIDVDPNDVYRTLKDAMAEHPECARIETLEDRDWERAWMDGYAPIHISGKLWICPSWCLSPDPAAVNVVLDPGLAFGTGAHATTALCLSWLQQQALAGCDVIDFGCGSGILSIAALKLGARAAVGIDNDPRALQVSWENAERNGVADRFQAFSAAAVPGTLSGDIVVANILAQTLIDLSPELTARVHHGGSLALSGILEEQADEVRKSYSVHFDLDTETRDGWILLSGKKRETSRR